MQARENLSPITYSGVAPGTGPRLPAFPARLNKTTVYSLLPRLARIMATLPGIEIIVHPEEDA